MEQKNFKVIFELRDDLEEKEKKEAIEYIEKWKNKFNIEQLDENTYCRKGDNKNYSDDFGDISGFYVVLSQKKEIFKKLETIKVSTGKKYVAV